jgi:hypothetical protein
MRTKTPTVTDRQRIDAVFTGLVENGVAYLFNLHGRTLVREDAYNDFMKLVEVAGTDLWVGTHVGNSDMGGAFWGKDGVLYGQYPDAQPEKKLWWSFNHERPELAELLVALFTAQGFDVWWSGEDWDCVEVDLTVPRGEGSAAGVRAIGGRK